MFNSINVPSPTASFNFYWNINKVSIKSILSSVQRLEINKIKNCDEKQKSKFLEFHKHTHLEHRYVLHKWTIIQDLNRFR